MKARLSVRVGGCFGGEAGETVGSGLKEGEVSRCLFGDRFLRTCRSVSELLFFAGYGVWLVWKLISISMFSFAEGSPVNTVFHLVSLALLAASSLVTLRIDGSLALAVITGLLGVAVDACADNVVFIDLAVILYAGGITSFRKAALFSLVLLAVGSIVIVVSSQVGIIPDYLFPRGDATDRHGLGFLYCTNLSHLYLGMTLIYVYLRGNQAHMLEYGAILAIDFVIYYLTDSRNSCGLVLVAILLAIAVRYLHSDVFGRALLFLSRWAFIGFTIMGLLLAVCYDPGSGAWRSINGVTSNRIAQDSASLSRYGVLPFGQKIEFANRTIAMGETDKTERDLQPSGDTNIVESSFLNILITKGVVSLVAVLLAFWVALRKNEDYLLAAIMLVIAAHSAFDFQLINLLYTTFLFLVWDRCAESVDSLIGRRMAGRH